MDRNVWDCLTDCTQGQSYKPLELLCDNWAIYIHEGDLRGKLVFWFDCKNDTEQIESDHSDEPDFEFHIEYKKGHWYPLKDGYLPEYDPQGFAKFPGEKQHWTSFPETTCVGWRGHCLLWSKLGEMPDIVYT